MRQELQKDLVQKMPCGKCITSVSVFKLCAKKGVKTRKSRKFVLLSDFDRMEMIQSLWTNYAAGIAQGPCAKNAMSKMHYIRIYF